MSVPDFQTWFLPLLKRLANGEKYQMASLYGLLANDMGLSDEDRNELLPSGKQLTYKNRIGWARTYLKKAGLITSPERGTVQITDEGKSILGHPPEKLNVAFLRKYPAFVEFHTSNPDNEKATEEDLDRVESDETPEEILDRVYGRIKHQLASELLDKIKASPPEMFERLVVDLLLRMGYGGSREDAGRKIGRSGDGGIDGIIDEDPLGLDTVCIQAKRWDGTVGRPVVQAFAGSLEGFRARKGVLLTTSSFTRDARDYVNQIEKKIVLVDGQRLASLMIQHNLGVAGVTNYEVKRIDSDYFEED